VEDEQLRSCIQAAVQALDTSEERTHQWSDEEDSDGGSLNSLPDQ